MARRAMDEPSSTTGQLASLNDAFLRLNKEFLDTAPNTFYIVIE
jgi:hypothetical protein